MNDKIRDCFNPHHASMEEALIVRDKEVTRLERELVMRTTEMHNQWLRADKLNTEAAAIKLALEDAEIRLRGAGIIGGAYDPVKLALSSDAGRRVLDVVEAAKLVQETDGADGMRELREALVTMGYNR